MIRVAEIQGRSHVFTLKDGSTMRLMSRSHKDLEEDMVSDDIRIAEERGYIYTTKLADSPKKSEKVKGGE